MRVFPSPRSVCAPLQHVRLILGPDHDTTRHRREMRQSNPTWSDRKTNVTILWKLSLNQPGIAYKRPCKIIKSNIASKLALGTWEVLQEHEFAEFQMFLSKHIWLIKLYPKISSGNRQNGFFSFQLGRKLREKKTFWSDLNQNYISEYNLSCVPEM